MSGVRLQRPPCATAPGLLTCLQDGGQNPEHQGGRQGVTERAPAGPRRLGPGLSQQLVGVIPALGFSPTLTLIRDQVPGPGMKELASAGLEKTLGAAGVPPPRQGAMQASQS